MKLRKQKCPELHSYSRIASLPLELYDRQEMMLIHNEAYARHGCQFSAPEMQAHFDGQLWYTPVEGINTSAFGNEYEQANPEAIISYETSTG